MHTTKTLDIDDQPQAILTLVGDIYEAGLDPAHWSNVVSMAAAAIGGASSLIYGIDTAAPHPGWFGHCFPASAMQTYAEHYQSTNLWAHEIERRQIPVGVPVLTDALVDVGALERSEFFTDYLRQLDIYRACTVMLHKDAGSVRESHLCIYRSRSHAAFDARAGGLLQQLVPHIQRATRIGSAMTQFKRQLDNGTAALDQMAVGIALFSSTGELVFLNRAATAIINEADALTVCQRLLLPVRTQDAVWFKRLVSRAARLAPPRSGGAMQIIRISGKRPLQLIVTPLPERGTAFVNSEFRATAIGLIAGHEQQFTDVRTLLPHLFDLTAAETRVAIGLLTGLSVKAIAEEAQTTVNTVRTQIAQLFAKTGTHRQAEVTTLLHTVCGHVRTRD